MPAKSTFFLVTLGCGWLLAMAAGFGFLLDYEKSPGDVRIPPVRWPAASRIPLSGKGATLVMFAHPRCPCTRASLGELAVIMAKCQTSLEAHVVFIVPKEVDDHWTSTGLWNSAESIPNVGVLKDNGGVEANLFRADTSGYTVLYGPDGRLLYSGGITGARGHSGDNAGRSAVIALLQKTSIESHEADVFGCPLIKRK